MEIFRYKHNLLQNSFKSFRTLPNFKKKSHRRQNTNNNDRPSTDLISLLAQVSGYPQNNNGGYETNNEDCGRYDRLSYLPGCEKED